MKIHVCRFALIAAVTLFLNSGWVCADNATNAAPAPGTAESKDSKIQENNGPEKQVTAHPKEGTKKKKHKTHAPASQTTASGDKATKTPQKDSVPSTTNP